MRKSSAFNLQLSALLALLLLLCAQPGAWAQGRRSAESHAWKFAFELAFDPAAPYCAEFPNLYKQPYRVNRAITKDVLDRVALVTLKETGARRVRLAYLPGGYMDFDVVPSAQLDVRATEKQARAALNVIGYLVQQSLVIASRRASDGARRALQITQTRGSDLASPNFAQRFWRRLSVLEPRLKPGFSGTLVEGRPGLYLIDTEGDWPSLVPDSTIHTAVAAVSKEFKIETRVEHFRVEYIDAGNDWKLSRAGEEYLRHLRDDGHASLARRLESFYQPRVRRWIAVAFRRQGGRVVRTPCEVALELEGKSKKAKGESEDTGESNRFSDFLPRKLLFGWLVSKEVLRHNGADA